MAMQFARAGRAQTPNLTQALIAQEQLKQRQRAIEQQRRQRDLMGATELGMEAWDRIYGEQAVPMDMAAPEATGELGFLGEPAAGQIVQGELAGAAEAAAGIPEAAEGMVALEEAELLGALGELGEGAEVASGLVEGTEALGAAGDLVGAGEAAGTLAGAGEAAGA